MVVGHHRINFRWLIRLRWAAIAGQLTTIAVARWGLDVHLPLAALFGIVGGSATLNIACALRARGGQPVSEPLLGGTMALDVLLFTALLYFSGGPANPFSFLYLVYIALAAIVLAPIWTWALAGLSLAGSAVLFVDAHEVHVGHSHAEHMSIHLRGMWVALGVAAAFIVYFVMRVSRSLAEREADLTRARALADRQERLASLATLAAGAAHELSTPLSTIATVAKELERATEGAVLDDVQLIRSELGRCKTILTQMSTEAGEMAGEDLATVSVRTLVSNTVGELRSEPPIEVDYGNVGERTLEVPARAVGQAIRGVLKNAQDATRNGKPVQVRAAVEDRLLRLVVRDRGVGMSKQAAERAGEPFYTTKEVGRGMGLGLFLTRAVLERLGGGLQMESVEGAGTTATMTLPVTAATNDRMGSTP